MPSSFTALGFELQAAGENLNTWGDSKLNNTIKRVNNAVGGYVAVALVGDYTLTSDNTSTAQADYQGRNAILKFTGSGAFTVTVPATPMRWGVWNACTGIVTMTTGSGDTVALQPGERLGVFCDGTNVEREQGTFFGGQRLTSLADPTSPQDAATKAYADALAFTANAGILPGQIGNSGKFLTTNGTAASWGGLSASASAVRTGTTTALALTPGDTYNALAIVTITYAASVAPDMGSFINGAITLTGNLTLANPTNHKVGQTGFIELIQDATGSRLLSAVGSFWKRVGGLGVLTTTAATTDILVYQVLSSTLVVYDILRNPT